MRLHHLYMILLKKKYNNITTTKYTITYLDTKLL